jgi:hypothetical protein
MPPYGWSVSHQWRSPRCIRKPEEALDSPPDPEFRRSLQPRPQALVGASRTVGGVRIEHQNTAGVMHHDAARRNLVLLSTAVQAIRALVTWHIGVNRENRLAMPIVKISAGMRTWCGRRASLDKASQYITLKFQWNAILHKPLTFLSEPEPMGRLQFFIVDCGSLQ